MTEDLSLSPPSLAELQKLARSATYANGTMPRTIYPKFAELHAALERLAALPDILPGWQPIETAPQNSNDVLLYVVEQPSDYTAAVGEPGGWAHVDIGHREGCGWDHKWSGQPTHWQPLPALPIAMESAQ